MFKRIVILILLIFVVSCQKADDSKNINIKKIYNIKNNQKSKKIKLSNEILLEYALNGYYIKGKVKTYPKNGTFIPSYEISLYNKDNRKIELPELNVIDIRISKSGDKILYLSREERLYYYDLNKKKKILISKSSFPTFQFSNNESKIAYFEGEIPNYNLFLYDIDKKSKKQITNTDFSTWSVAFSENDENIYFIYSPKGHPALFKYDIKTEKLIEINPELKLFPSERKPFLIFKNNLIFKNSKNKIILVDFSGKNKKIIGYGEVLLLNSDKIIISKDGIISTIKVGKNE